MKLRLLWIILLGILLVMGLQIAGADGMQTATEEERADILGIGKGIRGEYATYSQLFSMLDRVVEISRPEKLDEWKTVCPKGRNNSSHLDRYDGMCAVFLAGQIMGGGYCGENTEWISLHTQIGEPWDDCIPGSVFSDYEGKEYSWGEGSISFDAGSYFYAMGRRSKISEKRMFEYDPQSNSMRLTDLLTVREARLASLRLYDSELSNYPIFERGNTAVDQVVLSETERKIQSILNSETNVTISGTRYYVSNDGNDENDGLSPETAWASLSRVNDARDGNPLREGDGVFFRRGDLWRGTLWCEPGVTYSAYGIGDKPRIYGSPENGAGAEKWILDYENGSKKIWRFYREMTDCGNIVLNDGEGYLLRIFSYWDGNQSVCQDNREKVFDYKEDLPDMQFYSTFDMSRIDITEEYGLFDYDSTGPLYVRCDAGNPGELYSSIEFQASVNPAEGYSGIVEGARDNVIDNLCLRYRSTIGAHTGYTDASVINHVVIQNCEVGWIGGGTHSVNSPDGQTGVSGEGIRMEGNQNVTRNCYVHDTFDGGIICEFDLPFGSEAYYSGMVIDGNVIERCLSGVMIGDHNEDRSNTRKVFGDVSIAGNTILYSGYGWSGDDRYKTWIGEADGIAISFWYGPSYNDGISVKDNLLFSSRYALIAIGMDEANFPVFYGNTYAQNTNGILLDLLDPQTDTYHTIYDLARVSTDIALREELGDMLPRGITGNYSFAENQPEEVLVTRGKDVQFSMMGIEDAQYYWIDVIDDEGRRCYPTQLVDGETVTLLTAELPAGTYRVFACFSMDGSVWMTSSGNVSLTVQESDEQTVILTTEKTKVKTHEEIRWTVYAPDAVSISVDGFYLENNNLQYIFRDVNNAIEEHVEKSCLNGKNEFGGLAGKAYLTATATFQDGTVVKGEPVEITVTVPYGDLYRPMLRGNLWQMGDDLHFSVCPDSRTEWYEIQEIGCAIPEENTVYYRTADGEIEQGTKEFDLLYGQINDLPVVVRVRQSAVGFKDNISDFVLYPIDRRNQIVLPSELTFIDAEAFVGNVQATHVIIPENVVTIGDSVFAECDALSTIEITASEVMFGKNVFGNKNLTVYGRDANAMEYMEENGITYVLTD